jgi:subtilase family protein
LLALTLAALAAPVSTALATFPYGTGPQYKVGNETPGDLAGDDNDWKFAATPESLAPPSVTSDPRSLFGVRGAHVADATDAPTTAWETTTGRPDVGIAVLDSGIRWDEGGTMQDLGRKVRLNRGELPLPDGCTQYDCNGDNVFDVTDYAGDSRVNLSDSRRVGPSGVMTPQDLLIAFSDSSDADANGYVDDIAGWDFLDNDNDAYDDVHYGHGTGEAKDSSAEADNGGQVGSCPNCQFIPLRVGDSFIADVSNFGQAVIYAVDNGILVVQEALGTLNNSQLARQAVEYAYRHGVAVIASAADEAAQHHNWPSNYPHTIVVNSANKYNDPFTPLPRDYVQFNGCTNFSTHNTVAIPSDSCSSNATGLGAGMAGLIYSAALNAIDNGDLDPHPNCELTSGDPCPLTANEVRQLMASGTVNTQLFADDINFATQPEPSCTPVPAPGCTDKNRLFTDANANRPVASPLAESKSYPARKDFDEYYGYGRANTQKSAGAAVVGTIPPEAEITSPEWYAHVDPNQPTAAIRGEVYARGATYTCRVEVAPGSEPNNGRTTDIPPGDFKQVTSSWCNGSNHSSSFDGVLASLDLADLRSRFPVATGSFNGPEPTVAPPNFNNRPNQEPFGFVVRVVITSVQGANTLTGQDRRNFFLHRDQDLLPGFPKLLPGDGESSPVLVDLDGDNQNELVFGNSDGIVYAYHRDGTQLTGWPVHVDPIALHTGGEAFTGGEVDTNASYGAILASIAATDLDHDGKPEVIAADMQGKLYVWNDDGSLRFKREANIDYSGKPLSPFANVRRGERYRTQHGFLGSPVAADLDGNGGDLEIVAANMDRHVYAWHADGSTVDGFPVLVIDRSKITGVDSRTHAPTFAGGIGANWNQGAIVDTPAVGDLTGDAKAEIVVGTNEEYEPSADGGVNAGNLNTASLQVLAASGQLEFANSRVFAIKPEGEPGAPAVGSTSAYVTGWPKKAAFIKAELLPVVGEGITGSPVIGVVNCPVSGGSGPKVGAISAAGPAYLWNPDGTSCYGTSPDTGGNQQDNVMGTDFAAGGVKFDTPAIPAVGHPAFGQFAGGTSFVVPAAGAIRAVDLVANEYQGGQDFVAAYDPSTGQFRAGFPSPVNDLQFLSGPSIADLDGLPGEEVFGGTASLDLYGMNAAGAPFDPLAWPKLTADWTVANPVAGSFGTIDTSSGARKVVVGLTRTGSVLAYNTDAPACSPSSWPRFHHDNASSGDMRRDAVSPGWTNADVDGNTLVFNAVGDDLLCGTVDHYEIAQSNSRITGANFENAEQLSGEPAPQQPGPVESYVLPANPKRFVAIRAVDEQGNVGRIATVEFPSGYARPKGASPDSLTLVPAFDECTSSNASHGAPLASPSCNPPSQSSDFLTLGAPDVNGLPARGAGSVQLKVLQENPINPSNGDQGDVQIDVRFTDVRNQSDLSDYTGELRAVLMLRTTDRFNGELLEDPATAADTPLAVTVPCSSTPGPEGGDCNVSTTADAVMAGVVREGERTIWALGRFELFDGGADGDAETTGDNTLFAVPGAFVP